MTWALDACEDMYCLVGLLLADVEEEDRSPAPHRMAGCMIALAIQRPELLFYLLFVVRRTPALLADLLLYPATSALVCLLVGQWQSPPGAWDRELTKRDDQAAKAIAFADAVSVMGHFLQQGSVRSEDVTALLDWLHSSAQHGFIDDLGTSETMLTILRSELVGQSIETLRSMVSALIVTMTHPGFGMSHFVTALYLVEVGKLAGEVDPEPLVKAYIHAVVAGSYTLSAHRVGAGGAASLFELATRSPPELYQKFLYPVDTKSRLAIGTAAEENPVSLDANIARSIRTHIRVLSRAVIGWKETAPDDLVEALIAAVRAGALTHKEKGRVAAFSPRYEGHVAFQGQRDRPIAADLGEALAALTDERRERLLAGILETDEPMILAQLLSFAPHLMRASIQQRIADLTPSNAGDIYTLTEVQARIEELLSAGALDAAAQFMEVERDLAMRGNVPGRDLTFLRHTLWLQLLRGNWAAIANTQPPQHLSPAERASANDTISFFKALATLKRPDGDLQVAEQVFAQLHARRPDVVAYAKNLFATRISLLLRGNLFGLLHGNVALRARRVLRDADEMTLDPRAVSASDSERFRCNKALLLLALGQPDQVVDLLTPLRAVRLHDTIAAYRAVALSRMGRVREAVAALDAAEQAFGGTDVLRAARGYIESGTSYSAVATVSLENDPMPGVKLALWDLSQMDPVRQAGALRPGPEPFESLVIDYVRLLTRHTNR